MDPNAPRPEGNLMTPISGEELLVRLRYFAHYFIFSCIYLEL